MSSIKYTGLNVTLNKGNEVSLQDEYFLRKNKSDLNTFKS